jgi:hypothetical protein
MRGEKSNREAIVETLRRKWDTMQNHLDERGRRIWAAVRRKHWDTATPQNSFKRFRLWFGVTIVHEATGMSRSAITQGIAEMAHPQDAAPPDRARLFGGGRKKNQ